MCDWAPHGIRKEFCGHEWEWQEETNLEPHWKSTSGNVVRIFPPLRYSDGNSWRVVVCDLGHYEIVGENVAERAFSVGEVFARQPRSGDCFDLDSVNK